MVFVWTDQLADVVAGSGVELDESLRSRMEEWRLRPTAYRLPDDGDVVAFALGILELAPPDAGVDMGACGAMPVADVS